MEQDQAEIKKPRSYVISWIVMALVLCGLLFLNYTTRAVTYDESVVLGSHAYGWPLTMNHELWYSVNSKVAGYINGKPVPLFNRTGAIVNGITAVIILSAFYLLTQFIMRRKLAAIAANRRVKDGPKKRLHFSQFNLHTSLAITIVFGILAGVVKWMIVDLKFSPSASIRVILFGIVTGILITGVAHKETND